MIQTKYRHIVTEIPNKNTLNLIKELNKYGPVSYQEHQLPVEWAKAADFNVWDSNGNKFIDFTSGIFVANIGHGNRDICNTIRKKSNIPLLYSYTYPNEIRLKALKKITKFTGFEKAFLLSTGAEAVEAACKMMRLYGKSIGKNMLGLLSFEGSMHGKTSMAENLRGETIQVTNGWANKDNSVLNLKYPFNSDKYEQFIKYLYPNDLCGIIIESYRGWDAKFFNPIFIQGLVKWCNNNNILVCFDEIQSGMGRTGTLFAYEHYKVKPDLICLGKGLGNGYPVSAVLGSSKILDIADDLSSTHAANPLASAIVYDTIDYFQKHNVVKQSKEKGIILQNYLKRFYEKFKCIIEINSTGLVGAVVFKNNDIATKICYQCMKKGLLLVHTSRQSIKIGPPLIIHKEALIEGLDILEETLKENDD
jgi:4-aminobutyrate aminotransferase/(S)-3-amino-2-methylpropionate transaminase